MTMLKALLPLPLLTLATAHPHAALEQRDLVGNMVSHLGADGKNLAKVASALVEAIEATVPTATITSPAQASSVLSGIFATATNFLDTAPALIAAGFDPDDIQDIVEGYSPAQNSVNNTNPAPPKNIYPASPADAPYSLSESTLRSGIYIPPTFTYGKKPPVILFPGTGVAGGMTWAFTYGDQLAKEPNADPVWVNIPKFSLDDAQLTAEYAAYAMSYIGAITNRNTTIITFSQGSLNVQWALKYWPSTRSVITDFIALSPDYRGTVKAGLICPQSSPLGCTPSILQQKTMSKFVKTLLANGGGSAYVRTTNVRSATDQIVQPQAGPHPSGVLADARNVGVANYLVQDVCPASPAGTLVTHAGIIYNSLAFDLVLDVLNNGGPGQASRLNLPQTCSRVVAQGDSLNDLVAVESTFVVFLTNFAAYMPRTFVEPPIKAYAT